MCCDEIVNFHHSHDGPRAQAGVTGWCRAPFWAAGLWLALSAFALVGLWRIAHLASFRISVRSPRSRVLAVLGAAVCADLLAIGVYAQMMDGLWHGRFLLPSGIAIAALTSWGLAAIDRRLVVALAGGLFALAVTPGQKVDLTLYWQIIGPVDREWTLFVHLNDAHQQTLAQYDGFDSMRYWAPGKLFAQHVVFTVPPAVLPGDYPVRAGFYKNVDGQLKRPSVLTDGKPTDTTDVPLGDVQVRLPSSPAVAQADGVHFDNGITLLGWTWREGIMTLDWTTVGKPRSSYKVFVHFLDSAGQVVAQHDGLPSAGNFPTTFWRPGDVVVDPHQIEAPPGSYTVEVGLDDPVGGVRLRTLDGGDRVVLGTVTVGPNVLDGGVVANDDGQPPA